jgi:RHS repeat-associated protein
MKNTETGSQQREEQSAEGKPFYNAISGKTKSNAIEIPTINLPKGGGAMKGIDEKFSVNTVNGTASISFALPTAAARGLAPDLSLGYDSGSGNGIFGLGWNLTIPSIKRKTDKGLPTYEDGTDSDTFLLDGSEDLVPEFKKNADGSFEVDGNGDYVIHEKNSPDNQYTIRFYKRRVEGTFDRIERWRSKTSYEIKWRVITGTNITTLFGWTTQSRIADPKDESRVFAWFPEFMFDDKGNCVQYEFKKEDNTGADRSLLHHRNRIFDDTITYTNLYLSRVLYGNRTPYAQFNAPFPDASDYFFQTIFDFGEYDTSPPYNNVSAWKFRSDSFSDYKSGFEIRTTRLCQRVLLFHFFDELPGGSALVTSMNFSYDTDTQEEFTFLQSITSFGYTRKENGTYSWKSLPPYEFEYQKHDWNKELKVISPEALIHAPVGLDNANYQFVDLFNEGLNGILKEETQGWFYKSNLGDGNFATAKLISPKPSLAGIGEKLQFMDLDGDGGKQLVSLSSELPGYFELGDDQQWQTFRTLHHLPNLKFDEDGLRMLDLNGDGKPEILLSEENAFIWYPSNGRNGFESARRTTQPVEEEEGPQIIFRDQVQTIFLADMSGDGLTDIVRIKNGEVSYWPNLGYGKFGARINMDDAPVFDHPELFDPSYIRLADIDGSGTADIIYLGRKNFTCWMNRSGNAFSKTAFVIDSISEIKGYSKVSVTDLLGNGVACVVCSSALPEHITAPLKYIDLMNSRKPHIMVGYKNNMGKEVSLEYTPSTKFYLEDKLAGKPWATTVHFPVHCVSKTETWNRISGSRFVSTYRYRHGYFDHAEREFRGFGMIEQTDSEQFEHFIKSNASNIVDREIHQDPVINRNWFHTGAFIDRENILGHFADEYWYEETKRRGYDVVNHELSLPDARVISSPGLNLPASDLTTQEWCEALRACKGMSIRSEIFVNDIPPDNATEEQIVQALTPFAVSASNCVIELLQPKGKNKHAVFTVKQSEAITYSYERKTEDPRIAHNFNIRFDDVGNVLESAAIVYPRLKADLSLPLATQQEQARTVILFTSTYFTNDVKEENAYRLRVPAEVKTFECKGIQKSTPYYTLLDLENVLTDAVETAYHETDIQPAPGIVHKRLIEHLQTTYYRNDLTGPLLLNELDAIGLPFESYQLAYTPALLEFIFGQKVNNTLLQEGKFIDLHSDGRWWIPSGTVQLISGAETLADAQSRFYVPVSFTDPYGAQTQLRYYSDYYLLIKEIEDPMGNKSVIEEFNFKTLAPRRIRDINNNISMSLTDELGLVKATAVFGKGNEADDLSGLTDHETPADVLLVNSFFNASDSALLTSIAKELLQHATIRYAYDFDVYQNSGGTLPVVTATITREEFYQKNNNSPVQVSFMYGDGSGQIVMTKNQAEPGPAKKVLLQSDDTYIVTTIDTSALEPRQLRWIGNGRTIMNNKGNPVKQYEPYFSVTHAYESAKELVESGVTEIIYYDALGRVRKAAIPDGTFARNEFDSWKNTIYDQHDTISESEWYLRRTDNTRIDFISDPKEQQAALKSVRHFNTPVVQYLDTLGRVILSVDHNRDPVTDDDTYLNTIVKIDPEGNLREVIDARGNTVSEYRYDMLGNNVYERSMDKGQRWAMVNILGSPLRSWDERNHEFQFSYDILHRPVQTKVIGGDGETPLDHIFERVFYGEGVPDAIAKNLRGKAVRNYDTAGLVEIEACDFAGNPLAVTRRLFSNYKGVANWTDANLMTDLEAQSFTFTRESDALGRLKTSVLPDSTVITQTYNEAGFLVTESVSHEYPTLPPSLYIKDIDYNERGDRTKIIYGNDVLVRLAYDPYTFRIKHIEARRQNNDLLQDLFYTYDAVGNILEVEDKSIPVVFFNNQKITGISTYTYDALYRLTEATGRENDAALAFTNVDNWNDNSFIRQMNPGDPMTIRNYTQRYRYDGVGNILQMRHVAAGNNWTREYQYQNTNNRLSTTQVGASLYQYQHHLRHGFMTAMPHLEEISWNFKEEVIKTIRQKRNDGGIPETTYYQYDKEGQRVRKITENQADAGNTPTIREERIYVNGYELYRKVTGTNQGLERRSINLMDGDHRFALIEIRNEVDDDTEKYLVRYQLQNHLDSVNLELDQAAQVISYEEYHPFGTTSYQAKNATIRAAAKRYRYTGMERDEETGLSYHSARYYLTWLGRWLSGDPIGIGDGLNVYCYGHNNPVMLLDPGGTKNVPSNANDRKIADMEDPELYRYLKGLSPEERAKFANGAKGEFADRAWKMINKYNMERVYTLEEVTIEGVIEKPPPPPKKAASNPLQKMEKCYVPGREPNRPPVLDPATTGPTLGPRTASPPMVIIKNNGKEVWRGTLDQYEAGTWMAGAGGRSLPDYYTIETVDGYTPPDAPEDDVPSDDEIVYEAGLLPGSKNPMENRPAHVYEIFWKNLDTGEEGVFKYGISREKNQFTKDGISKRAQSQVNAWNKALKEQGYRNELRLGRVWKVDENGKQLVSPGAAAMEKNRVDEFYRSNGRVPPGNQYPKPHRTPVRRVAPPRRGGGVRK